MVASEKQNKPKAAEPTPRPASTASIYGVKFNWLELVRVQRLLTAVVAAAACRYCCICVNESASPKPERGMNKKKRGGRGYLKGWMGHICKDPLGYQNEDQTVVKFSAQNGIRIIQRRGWLILGSLLQRNDSVDFSTFDSSRRDRSNEPIFTARF